MARRARKKSNVATTTISNIFTIFSYTFMGKIVTYAVLAIIVILITAIATGNDYDRFFTAMGVEVLIVTIAGWIFYIALKNNWLFGFFPNAMITVLCGDLQDATIWIFCDLSDDEIIAILGGNLSLSDNPSTLR